MMAFFLFYWARAIGWGEKEGVVYFLLRVLLRGGLFRLVRTRGFGFSSFGCSNVGVVSSNFSSSRGSGGGVVSIVHPIHMVITSAARTSRRIGSAIAQSLKVSAYSMLSGRIGAKKANRYTMVTRSAIMKIPAPKT